eukprot:4323691-Pyramimonas_sp.AAC.1
MFAMTNCRLVQLALSARMFTRIDHFRVFAPRAEDAGRTCGPFVTRITTMISSGLAAAPIEAPTVRLQQDGNSSSRQMNYHAIFL